MVFSFSCHSNRKKGKENRDQGKCRQFKILPSFASYFLACKQIACGTCCMQCLGIRMPLFIFEWKEKARVKKTIIKDAWTFVFFLVFLPSSHYVQCATCNARISDLCMLPRSLFAWCTWRESRQSTWILFFLKLKIYLLF